MAQVHSLCPRSGRGLKSRLLDSNRPSFSLGCLDRLNKVGIEGPKISVSKTPERKPRCAKQIARLAEEVMSENPLKT
jgi:hypothetical protein